MIFGVVYHDPKIETELTIATCYTPRPIAMEVVVFEKRVASNSGEFNPIPKFILHRPEILCSWSELRFT